MRLVLAVVATWMLVACARTHEVGCDRDCGALDAAGPDSAGGLCVPGRARACSCDGASGAERCDANGRWSACVCDVDAAVVHCEPGATRLCGCGQPPRVGQGIETCDASGTWGHCEECVCGFETCEGTDDDCDGRIDEEHVCPDPTIGRVVPFVGNVYVSGYDAARALHVLVPIWPTRRARLETPVMAPGELVTWAFDGQGNVYAFTASEIHHVAPLAEPGPALPCPEGALLAFFPPDRFVCRDGYYVGTTFVRDLQPFDERTWSALDGAVAGLSDRHGVVLDAVDGRARNVLDLSDWPGIGTWTSSVASDGALYAATGRCWPIALNSHCEQLGLRIEPDGWSVVRRVPDRTGRPLLLSDGSFVWIAEERPGGPRGIQVWIDRPGSEPMRLFRATDELDFDDLGSGVLWWGP